MAAPRGRRIDEIGEESRRRILDAAEELFAEKGFEKTSFVDIAHRSGISRGSIPWHFKNKDGLLMAVAERAIARGIPAGQLAAEVASPRRLLDQVGQMMKEHDTTLLYMVLNEILAGDSPLREQYVEFFRRRRGGTADWIQACPAPATPGTRAEVDVLAAVINSALLGLHLQWTLDPAGVDYDAAVELLGRLTEKELGLAPDR
ncbi:TetR/AcrR family transcriptional regulator [Nocardia sp. NBC_01499]|uniref:TetR/AcrR family transcriptional regulator n=1 Tax=Nocardia sp. NBC_01499 TaxID=2903597 RepID=UPI00386A2C38